MTQSGHAANPHSAASSARASRELRQYTGASFIRASALRGHREDFVAAINTDIGHRSLRPERRRVQKDSDRYIVRRGAVCRNSCTCCFQNFGSPTVPWPRVSSLAGIR